MNLLVSKDPRCEIIPDSSLVSVVDTGGQRVTYVIEKATNASYSATSIQSASWTINPPSNQTIISREINIRYYVEITVDEELQDLKDCLRQFPIASVTESMLLKINGSAVSTKQVGDFIHAEMCFYNECEDRRKAFMCPAYPDQYGDLADGANFNRNPAGEYGDLVTESTRKVAFEQITDAPPYKYRVVVTEPLFISPLLDGVGMVSQGLINVNELYIQILYKTYLERVMTCMIRDVGPQITNVQCGFYEAPEVLLCYITPNMMQYIEPVQTLPFINPIFNRNIEQRQWPRGGPVERVTSQYYRLGMIPKYMMLFCQPSDSLAHYNKNTANGFLEIVSINVKWNNENSLLVNATQQDLYQISRRNGINMSFEQWKTKRGSVVMIEFGRDLGLPDGLSPGTVGSYTLSVDMNVRNTALADNVVCDYNIVLYNQGSFVISQNSGRTSEGLLTPQMVLMAEKAEMVSGHEHPAYVASHSLLSRLSGIIPKGRSKGSGGESAPVPPAPEPRRIGGSLSR